MSWSGSSGSATARRRCWPPVVTELGRSPAGGSPPSHRRPPRLRLPTLRLRRPDRRPRGAADAAGVEGPPPIGQRPTANANRQPPTANRTANRQPPTANRQSPTANRQPPTANRQSPTAIRHFGRPLLVPSRVAKRSGRGTGRVVPNNSAATRTDDESRATRQAAVWQRHPTTTGWAPASHEKVIEENAATFPETDGAHHSTAPGRCFPAARFVSVPEGEFPSPRSWWEPPSPYPSHLRREGQERVRFAKGGRNPLPRREGALARAGTERFSTTRRMSDTTRLVSP